MSLKGVTNPIIKYICWKTLSRYLFTSPVIGKLTQFNCSRQGLVFSFKCLEILVCKSTEITVN